MATYSIDHLIKRTPKGVKVDLRALYVYADGHGNVTFGDGTNWPINDPYEFVEILIGKVLRPMQKEANRYAHEKRVAAARASGGSA